MLPRCPECGSTGGVWFAGDDVICLACDAHIPTLEDVTATRARRWSEPHHEMPHELTDTGRRRDRRDRT